MHGCMQKAFAMRLDFILLLLNCSMKPKNNGLVQCRMFLSFEHMESEKRVVFISLSLKATFHLTSMRGKRATGKIQRNNYHHGS